MRSAMASLLAATVGSSRAPEASTNQVLASMVMETSTGAPSVTTICERVTWSAENFPTILKAVPL